MATDAPPRRGRFRHKDWRAAFESAYRDALAPGAQVLDVGSGRRPTIPIDARPAGVTYVGLDISQRELEAAPPGSYDETHVSDVETPIPGLAGRFDLIVSWQVLEHVADLEATLSTLRGYLRPAGVMVLEFTGKWSIPGVLGRIVPARLGRWGLVHLVGRKPEGIFPAHFDRCSASDLRRFLQDASEVRIEPRFSSAGYFRRVPLLRSAWSRVEDLMIRGRHDDLASYYLVVARR
jgi:SAM-dependent methyltransferase